MTRVVTPQSSAVIIGPATTSPDAPLPRLYAIDLVRGVVMVLMVLDHTRGFFTHPNLNPLDLQNPWPTLFLTRWVTHFCAPVFVFLAGTGSFLYGSRCKARGQLAWFLVTRGVWLLFLEFSLVHLGWAFSFDYQGLFAQVIWVIGWSLILLACLVRVPAWVVAIIGMAIIMCQNLLDLIPAETLRGFGWPVVILLRPGILELPYPQGVRILALYSILPWFGILAAGYGFGALWLLERGRRRQILLLLGIALTLLFVVLRYVNGYGDPNPWAEQRTVGLTFLWFLDCTKYPPSLTFVAMTLGPAILAMALFDGRPGPVGSRLAVFGRVPLFFYLLHVPLIHFFAVMSAEMRFGDASFLFGHLAFSDRSLFPTNYTYPLRVVYFMWGAVVLCLYPPCAWFAEVKRRHRDGWLSYL
jgi:uncharacterized membrane protein